MMHKLIARRKQHVTIGTSPDGGTIAIPADERAAHLHVLGVTRSGKSRFLADLIRQDIAGNRGLCLIDPHGELSDLTIDWLTRDKVVSTLRKNIHPVDLSDLNTTFRYNPLHVDHPDEAYGVADNVVNAISRIFGGSNPNETPLTTEIMTMVCVLLAQNQLPLAAAQYFLYEEHEAIRQKIAEGAPSEWHKALSDEIARMGKREYRELIASTRRRFEPLIANPQVMRIFSTTENTVQFREAMDGGHVLLFDARRKGKVIGSRVLRTLGMLITNQIFATAFERDPQTKPRPFNLYIDEVQNFVSDDIEEILSQAAKFGLFLTLSHQYLGQLTKASEHIATGVMSGTLMKAVFALSMEEAKMFADELFSKEIDFQKVKEKIKTPMTVGHRRTWLDSESTTDTTSRSSARSSTLSESTSSGITTTEGAGSALSESGGMMYTPEGHITGRVDSSGTVNSTMDSYSEIHVSVTGSSYSTSEAYGSSQSKTEGRSETLEPIIEWHATQTYTLEEQRYDHARRIAHLPKRQGYFFVRGQGVIGFRTRDIPDPLDLPIAKQNLLTRLASESPWLTPTSELKNSYTEKVAKYLAYDNDGSYETDDFYE